MAKDAFVFQYLKEKMDKGFPEPRFPDLIKDGTYMSVAKHATETVAHTAGDKTEAAPKSTTTHKVAMFFDGPFLPVRNGICYTIINLMKTLGNTAGTDVEFINCYRGWDDLNDYHDQNFGSVFLTPDDYFRDTGLLQQAMIEKGIQIAHFFDTEVMTTIAPRLKKLGIKVVMETQNIDHVLLERLKVSQADIDKARSLQTEALKMADFNLFRSDVDMEWGLKLGAEPATSVTYKGGICVDDFVFKTRDAGKKLVFLGHMFYQPNENALTAIVNYILPKLPNDYTLTVIGIAPPALIERYGDNPNISFLSGVDDLSTALLSYDIALAPLIEGSGTRLKLLDYLASGLPVISTTIGAEGLMPEIHDYLTIEDSIDKYAEQILAIGNDPAFYAERAKHGRDFVEREYDWSRCIQPFTDAYERLLAAE